MFHTGSSKALTICYAKVTPAMSLTPDALGNVLAYHDAINSTLTMNELPSHMGFEYVHYDETLAGFLQEHHLGLHELRFSQVQLLQNSVVREGYVASDATSTLQESPAVERSSQAAAVVAPPPPATISAVDPYPHAIHSVAAPSPAQETAYVLQAPGATHARPEYIRQHLAVASVSPTLSYPVQSTTVTAVAPQYAPSNGIQPGAVTTQIPLNAVIKSAEAFPRGHLYGNHLPTYRDKPPQATKYFPVFKAFQLALGRRIIDPPTPVLLPRVFPNNPHANHPRRGSDLHELIHGHRHGPSPGHHQNGHGRRQQKQIPVVRSIEAYTAGQGLGHTLASPGHDVGRPAIFGHGIPTVAYARASHGHGSHAAYVPGPVSSPVHHAPSLAQGRAPADLQNAPSHVVFETAQTEPRTSVLQRASVISAPGTTVYHHATTVVQQDAREGSVQQQYANRGQPVPVVPDAVFVHGAAAENVSPTVQGETIIQHYQALLSDNLVQENPSVQTRIDDTRAHFVAGVSHGVPPPVPFQTTLHFTKQAVPTPTAPGLVLHVDHPVVAVASSDVGNPAVVDSTTVYDLYHGAYTPEHRHVFMAGLGIGHSLSYGVEDGHGWEWRYLDARRRKK